MKRATLMIAVLLAACEAAPTEPTPELDCVPPGPEAEWCHHLDNDAVSDSLLPLPVDSASH